MGCDYYIDDKTQPGNIEFRCYCCGEVLANVWLTHTRCPKDDGEDKARIGVDYNNVSPR